MHDQTGTKPHLGRIPVTVLRQPSRQSEGVFMTVLRESQQDSMHHEGSLLHGWDRDSAPDSNLENSNSQNFDSLHVRLTKDDTKKDIILLCNP
jgi:hypothetical protein